MIVDRIVLVQAGIFTIETGRKFGLIKADPKYAFKLTNPRGVIELLPEENVLRSSLGGKIAVELLLAPDHSDIKKAGPGYYMTYKDGKASLFSLGSQRFYAFPDGTAEIREIKNQLIPCRVKEKWGLYDLMGNERLRPAFDGISWVDSYWLITDKGRSAILTPDLKVIHDSNYRSVAYLGHKLFSAKKNGESYILSGAGDVIAGKKVVFAPCGKYGFWIHVSGKTGFLSNEGKIVIRPQFDSVSEIWPGNVFIVRKNSLYGLFYPENGGMIRPGYSQIKAADPERFLLVRENKKWGIIDLCGKLNLKPQLDSIDPSIQLKFLFSNEALGDTYLVQDRFLLSEKIESQERAGNNRFIVKNEKQWMLIDKNGKDLIGDGCEEISHITGKLLRFRLHGKYGIADTNGDLLCLPDYDEILPLDKTCLKVRIGRKWGVMDLTGNEILPVKYDSILSRTDSGFRVYFVQKHGVVSPGDLKFRESDPPEKTPSVGGMTGSSRVNISQMGQGDDSNRYDFSSN